MFLRNKRNQAYHFFRRAFMWLCPKSFFVRILAAVGMLLILSSCIAPKPVYFEQLETRRAERFRNWASANAEMNRSVVEGDLSIQRSIELALQYNSQLRIAIRERAKADGRIMEAYSNVLPSVNASSAYKRLDEIQTVDIGNESFPVGDRDNYSFSLEITQPVFTGGNAPIAIRAAKLFSYLSDEIVRSSVENVIYRTTKAYYDAKLADQLIAVQKKGLEAATSHLETVKAEREQEIATRYDVLRAKVDVSNFEAELIKQKNEKEDALGRLFKVMGVSQQSKVQLVNKFEHNPMEVTFSEAARKAYLNRPDLYTALLKLDLQEEAVRQSYTEYLPKINAFFSERWAKPDPHDSTNIDWGSEWQAGLRLEWALFDGLAREGNVVQKKAELEQRKLELNEKEQNALLEVRTALNSLQNADQLVETQKMNLERADRALELVTEGYKEGINTQVEVLDATAALTQARGLYYKALYKHSLARLELQHAMGMLGDKPGINSKDL